MTTRKRPQLGALFGGGSEASAADRGAARLRSVADAADAADAAGATAQSAQPAGSTGSADEGAAPRRAAGRTAPRVLLDADTPGPGSPAGQPLPWSPGGWLDPMVIAGQYFDFWQAVLDNSRRLVLGATATAIGRSAPDRD